MQCIKKHHNFPALLNAVFLCIATILFPHTSVSAGPAESQSLIKAFSTAEKAVGIDGYSKNTDGAALAWGESYVLMAYVAMYEGTRDEKYLDRAAVHIDRMLANRNDVRGVKDVYRNKAMPAWSTGKYSGGKQYTWIVHTGMINHPIARWAYVVRRDKINRLSEKAVNYIDAVRESLEAFESDWIKQGQVGYYKDHTVRGPGPLNMQTGMGRACLTLYLATGEKKYKVRAELIAKRLKLQLRLVGDRYDWSYWRPNSGSEDISHAAINADFAFLCYRAGVVFDKTDMKRFSQTLKQFTRSDGGYADTINGQGEGKKHGVQASRWLHFCFVDPSHRKAAIGWYESRWGYGTASMVAAAYLSETMRNFEYDSPISD